MRLASRFQLRPKAEWFQTKRNAEVFQLEWHLRVACVSVHFALTLAATLGWTEYSLPFLTSVVLCALIFLQDRTIYFVYPSLILMTLIFVSPLILAGAPIALKIPPNGNEYDRGMILGMFWFIGIFSSYVPVANQIETQDITDVRIGKTDFVTYLAAIILLSFSLLMLQGGTLASGGYRDVTETRYAFIEFASLFTLIGFCSSRSAFARKVLLVGAMMYLASSFMVGLRLRFISVAVVTFSCLVGIQIHSRWKLAGLIVAVILFVLGMIRNSGFSGANLGSAFSIQNMYNRGALVSTFGGAFQTSKFQAFYIESVAEPDGLTGFAFFLADLVSIFVTRSGLPDALELKARTAAAFDVPGGGLIYGSFYAYMGLPGVIMLSILFTAVFVYILRRTGSESFPYKVLLAAYAPRLLIYDWTVAFKMMFYFFIFKSILSLLAKASRKEPPAARTQKKTPRK